MAESSLLPVLSALGGVALAQGVAMIQSWLDRKNRRDVLLRTKYEELGLHFLESTKKPGLVLACNTHESALDTTQAEDANKVHLLALVYFPLLRHATGQYLESYSVYCATAILLYDPQNKHPLGTQVCLKPEYIEASNAHFEARNYLQDQIELHSATYVKA